MQLISVVKQKNFCEDSVKANSFLHFWEISRVPLKKLPRTTGGTRTTGWEPLLQWFVRPKFCKICHNFLISNGRNLKVTSKVAEHSSLLTWWVGLSFQ